jgi:hypothetical protein
MSRSQSSASSDEELIVTPSSKCARVGTITTRRKPMPLFTVLSLKDYNYDVIMEHLHDDPLDAMGISFGSDFRQRFDWDSDLLDQALIKVGEFTREGLPLSCLTLCWNISPHAEDAMDLQMSAMCTMSGGSEPWKMGYEKGQVPMTLYGRKGLEVQLLKKMPLWKGDTVVTWRETRRRSFVLVAPIAAIWPIPMTIGPRAEHSTLWSFTVIKDKDQWKVLAVIKTALANSFTGYMTPLLDKDGIIERRWWLQIVCRDLKPLEDLDAITKWLQDEADSGISEVRMLTQCSFCWRSRMDGTNTLGDHLTSKCSFLLAFNRMRAESLLLPVEVTHRDIRIQEGRLQLTVEKLAGEFNAYKKEVAKWMAKMEERTTTLESKGKRQRANDPEESPDASNTATSYTGKGNCTCP